MTLLKKLILLLLILLSTAYSTCAWAESSPADKTQVSSGFRLEPVDEARLKKILSSNKGNVVVLNFWATWCDPCREELPELIKIYANYRHKGMRLIFLSMDEQDEVNEVKKFLKENKVNFVSYIRSGGDFESLVNAIDPNWIGAIPATFVFDRQGKRVKTMIGGRNYEAFEKAIRPLLQKNWSAR